MSHFGKYWFLKFSKIPENRMYFGIVGLFCIINCYFEYRIRILCIFPYMGTYFKDIVRHFSTPKIKFPTPPKPSIFPEVWTIFVSRIFGPNIYLSLVVGGGRWWWWKGCFSDVRGPFRTQNPKTSPTNSRYENCSHFWDVFWKCSKQGSKTHLTYVPI